MAGHRKVRTLLVRGAMAARALTRKAQPYSSEMSRPSDAIVQQSGQATKRQHTGKGRNEQVDGGESVSQTKKGAKEHGPRDFRS